MIWRIAPLAFLTGMAASVLALWVMEREPPVVLAEPPSIETPKVSPGDVFYAQYVFFRKKSCTTHVDRFLMDTTRVRFVVPPIDFSTGSLPVGWDKARVPVTIPMNMAPGPAIYWTINTYYCNPVHLIWPIVAAPREIKFEVLPSVKKSDRILPE